MAKTDTGKNLSVVESSASASTNVSVTAGQLIVEDGGRAFYDNSLGERSRVGGTWLSDAEKSFIFTKNTTEIGASSLLISPTDSTYGWKFTGYDHIDLVHPSADGNIGFKYDSTGAGLVITNKSQNDASHVVDVTLVLSDATHKLSEKSEAKTYTVSVPTTSWTSTTSGSSTIYKKTITVTGITATDTPIVDVVLSDTVDTAKKELEAYGCISRITTAANSITIYCYESAPTTAFTIQLFNVTNRQ